MCPASNLKLGEIGRFDRMCNQDGTRAAKVTPMSYASTSSGIQNITAKAPPLIEIAVRDMSESKLYVTASVYLTLLRDFYRFGDLVQESWD